MRLIIIFCAILIPCIAKAQKVVTSKDTLLNWSERKLTWNDFQGVPPKDRGKNIARTKSLIYSKYSFSADTLRYEVPCNFFINKSWTITRSVYSLNHEQKHFDLAELQARWLRKFYNSLKGWDSNTKEKIRQKAEQLNNAELVLQERYDIETNYGVDSIEQKRWNVKVQKMLDSLDAYKQVKGTVILRKK
ncbi:hypothetical protein ACTHGU_03625 [Chitinophagaceae bacterium MMS25-I14]